MFALPWSVGAIVDPDGREKFDLFYRNLLGGRNTDHPVPKAIGKIEIPFPENGIVYDYCFEVNNRVV